MSKTNNMSKTVEDINDFVIVKTYGEKPYSVTKALHIDWNYPCYHFANYQEAINFIEKKTK